MKINNVSCVDNCYGCFACQTFCPKQAISFKLNNQGFFAPFIDSNKCSNCGLCLKKCNEIHNMPLSEVQATYYGWSKDKKIRNSSSSGGAFYSIAKSFIESGGVVAGASLIDPYNVKHIIVETIDDLALLQKSKYIQSDISDFYHDVLFYLKSNKKVLLCGTPCQIAAAKVILKNFSKQMFYIDLVCYGFINNGLYETFLKGLEQINKQQITSVEFRNKEYGNKMVIKSNEKVLYSCNYRESTNLGFYQQFINRQLIKETCDNCNFCSKSRVGDITLSDYPYSMSQEIDKDKLGVSVIYVNNKNGETLLNLLNDFHLCGTSDDIISVFSKRILYPNSEKAFNDYLKYSKKPKSYAKKIINFKNTRNFTIVNELFVLFKKSVKKLMDNN